MPNYYPPSLIRKIRNEVPINKVITQLLHLEVKKTNDLLRFKCPLCSRFHTATSLKNNLARCFDCEANFNPIDIVITVTSLPFTQTIEVLLKKFPIK